MLIVGLLSRFSAILLLLMQLILTKISASIFAYGADSYITIALFYCCIFPVGKTYYALDYKIFKKISAPSFYRNVFKIHLSIAYFSSGFDKLIGYNWWNGESIWKSMHLPLFNSFLNINLDFLADYPIILIAAGWATIIIEIFYPLFMWIKKTRRTWLILIIALHISIFITLGLYYFATLMILLNLAAFANLEKPFWLKL